MHGTDDSSEHSEGPSPGEQDFERVLEKMNSIRESLSTIEGWLDGEPPAGLALATGPTGFGHLRQLPLSIETIGDVIDREAR